MSTGPQDELFRRYLGILGWVGDPGLHELVSSHLIKVPLENVSALLRSQDPAAAPLPTIEEFVTGVADQDFGGTGFSIALHFSQLLTFLGYESELLGADVGGVPRSHAVCRVQDGGGTFLVDVGYGAPFYHPIALDELPARVPHGDLQFAVDRHVSGAEAVEVTTYHGGQKAQSYVARPPALPLDGLAAGAQRALEPTGKLMRSLRISRFFASRVLEVYDNALVTTHHNITTVAPIASVADLEVIVHELMQLPRLPVREAVEILKSRGVDVFPG